jgi:hypothetical protein
MYANTAAIGRFLSKKALSCKLSGVHFCYQTQLSGPFINQFDSFQPFLLKILLAKFLIFQYV